MGHCGHLSIEEREGVTLLARQHKGVREIARTIGRDKSAVSRELARLLPEGQEPGWRDWRGGERGPCHAQPQTAQAPRLEVPAGGLLLTGAALALKIRPKCFESCNHIRAELGKTRREQDPKD